MAPRPRRRPRRIRLTRAYHKINMDLEGLSSSLFNQGEQKDDDDDDNNKSMVIMHNSQIGFSIQKGAQEMSRRADKVEKLCRSPSLLPLAGVPGAVCGAAQPADPAGALHLPRAEVLLGTPVGGPTDMQEHA